MESVFLRLLKYFLTSLPTTLRPINGLKITIIITMGKSSEVFPVVVDSFLLCFVLIQKVELKRSNTQQIAKHLAVFYLLRGHCS